MEWIKELLWGEGIGHSLLLLAFTVAAGIQLGKIKVFGISLGVTWVLFVGIMLGHFGFYIHPAVIHFFQEFVDLICLFGRYGRSVQDFSLRSREGE